MASAWNVEVLAEANRNPQGIQRELGEDVYSEIMRDILALEEDPTPAEAALLQGTKDLYRIYTYRSLYRIIYQVLIRQRRVLVVRVGPRSTVYSGFDRW